MTYSDLTADQARRQLYSVMNRTLSFEQKAEQSLAIGEKYLSVENGYMTKIDQENGYWTAIASTADRMKRSLWVSN